MRHLLDKIEHPEKYEPYIFDPAVADHHIEFIEKFCKQSQGRRGEPLTLELFQKARLEAIFGFVDKNTGYRQYNEVLIIEGRKNGKTTETAAIELDMLLNDGAGAPEIYNIATRLEQAKKGFVECWNMQRNSTAIRKLVRKRQNDLFCAVNLGFIKPLAADTNGLDGLNAQMVVIDELAAIKNRDIYDLMKQSMGAGTRPQPLLFCISTNGFVRGGIFDDQYKYACNILDGKAENVHFLSFIYELDDREEWTDPDAWIKANPGLGTIKKVSFLRECVQKAKDDPAFLPTVLVKDFNFPENRSSAWLQWQHIHNDFEADLEKLHIRSKCSTRQTDGTTISLPRIAFYSPNQTRTTTVKASDNSVRSFMIHAKYAAGYGADGKLGSLSGAACAIRTISHNSQISMWKQRGAQYCGKSYADGGFVDLMFWLKYGDKANASKMQGCRNYAYTYAITVAQTDAKSVILKKTDAANLVVGSAIDVGDGSDRSNAASYAVASSAVILSIEAYDDNNSRVNLDLAAGITTTTSNKINTIAWRSGSCDNVLGVDGSPTNCTSGKEPFIIQGIECMVGAYEVYADAIFKLESADGVFKITPWICKKASEITNNAIGSAYKALSYSLAPPTSAGWRYISSMGFDPAHPCANFPDGLDANSNTGYRAGFYSENATNALREWLAVGRLGLGTSAALGCALSNIGLGNAWWYVSGRACGTAGNRGEFAA